MVTELPEGQKVLIFTFNVVLKDQTIEEAVDNMRPLMLLVFYFVDKIRRYRLSRYDNHILTSIFISEPLTRHFL